MSDQAGIERWIHRCGPATEPHRTTLLVGALVLTMILTSPVCHLHYFGLAVPLVMGLVVQRVHTAGFLGWRLTLVMGAYLVGTGIPSLPGMRLLRDGGLAMYAALLLWAVACLSARGAAVAMGAAARPARAA